VDFLTSGCRYDLKRRAGLVPEREAATQAAAESMEIGSLGR
jgi:hypothetical protein